MGPGYRGRSKFCPVERAGISTAFAHSKAGLDPILKPNEPLEVARDLRCRTLVFYGDQDGSSRFPTSNSSRIDSRKAPNPRRSSSILASALDGQLFRGHLQCHSG